MDMNLQATISASLARRRAAMRVNRGDDPTDKQSLRDVLRGEISEAIVRREAYASAAKNKDSLVTDLIAAAQSSEAFHSAGKSQAEAADATRQYIEQERDRLEELGKKVDHQAMSDRLNLLYGDGPLPGLEEQLNRNVERGFQQELLDKVDAVRARESSARQFDQVTQEMKEQRVEAAEARQEQQHGIAGVQGRGASVDQRDRDRLQERSEQRQGDRRISLEEVAEKHEKAHQDWGKAKSEIPGLVNTPAQQELKGYAAEDHNVRSSREAALAQGYEFAEQDDLQRAAGELSAREPAQRLDAPRAEEQAEQQAAPPAPGALQKGSERLEREHDSAFINDGRDARLPRVNGKVTVDGVEFSDLSDGAKGWAKDNTDQAQRDLEAARSGGCKNALADRLESRNEAQAEKNEAAGLVENKDRAGEYGRDVSQRLVQSQEQVKQRRREEEMSV